MENWQVRSYSLRSAHKEEQQEKCRTSTVCQLTIYSERHAWNLSINNAVKRWNSIHWWLMSYLSFCVLMTLQRFSLFQVWLYALMLWIFFLIKFLADKQHLPCSLSPSLVSICLHSNRKGYYHKSCNFPVMYMYVCDGTYLMYDSFFFFHYCNLKKNT